MITSTYALENTGSMTSSLSARTAGPAAAARTRTSTVGSDGFTLLELLLVLTILGVMAGLVSSHMGRWIDSFAFRDSVARLSAALNHAHYAALRESRELAVEPGPDGRSVLVAGERVPLPRHVRLEHLGRVAPDSHPVEEAFFFYPDGSADHGLIMVATPERTATIDIHPLTGKPSVAWQQVEP